MLFEVCVLFVLLLCFIQWRKRPQRFPPGPFSWPLVGNLVQVGMEPYKSVMTMRKQYGDIIGIDFGSTRAVFINEYKLVKEAFNMPAFSGRPKVSHLVNPDIGIMRGIIWTSGRQWMEQRRFAFSYIQSGFRNGVPVEKLITHESNNAITDIRKCCGKPTSTTKLFALAFVNSLWTVITGERFSLEDKTYKKLIQHIDDLASSPTTLGLLVFYPKLAQLVPKLSGFDGCVANLVGLDRYSQEVIYRHVDTYKEGVEGDFVDCFLKKIESTTDSQSSFFNKTGNENLRRTLTDIFMAGTETVSTTMRWFLFLMAQFLDAQKKFRHTIVNHIQKGGGVALKDRSRVPYVDASISEVLRYSSIVALGIFRETLEDVEFHGYFIPKGTMIVANQFGIHHDPHVWGDPENFRPERFLTDDESEVIRHPALIPFSTGKRVCPGEALARDELFIFTVSLFSHFEIQFDPNEPIPPLRHEINSILSPPEHKLTFQSLSSNAST